MTIPLGLIETIPVVETQQIKATQICINARTQKKQLSLIRYAEMHFGDSNSLRVPAHFGNDLFQKRDEKKNGPRSPWNH